MKVYNKTKDRIIVDNAIVLTNIFLRIKGLLGRNKLGLDEAAIITPCNSIHTFFMRFPIDVLFLDKQKKVIATLKNFVPWRISLIYWKSYFVVELPSGTIEKTNASVGDEIILT